MTTPPQAAGPNAEQITYWNATAGPKWVALQERLDTHIRELGESAMHRVGIRTGERVLDVGCGTGQTTLELARRVGPEGNVLGIDVSAPMLARARQRAAAAGDANVAFLEADAQTHRFDAPGIDVCFSRFGVMFFADPAAAFANLGTALRPGARLGFVCWQSLPENPWMFVPLSAAAQHTTLPPPPGPDAPGPFSFADAARVRRVLEAGGFSNVVLEDHRTTLSVGGSSTIEEAVEFLLYGVGPTSAALREADPAVRPVVAGAVREALAPYHTPGGVRMPAAAWLVTATRGS